MTSATHVTPLESWRPPTKRTIVASLGVGLGLLALCAVFGFFAPDRFFQAYLFGYLFWWNVTMGCVGLALLHNLTGGNWGNAIRPFLHAGMGTVLLVGVLFVPLVFGLDRLYHWMHLSANESDPVLAPKATWFNYWFFLGRTVGYFIVWLIAAAIARARARRSSAIILAGLVLTASFASIDWAMSLETHWFSTMYGALYVASALVAAMAVSIAFVAGLTPTTTATDRPTADVYNDLGNLLLAFVMLWAYFSFSQFLIVWSGNLPEENIWYVHRSASGWQWLALAVAVLHFVVPFLLLLSTEIKRNSKTIFAVAAALIFVRSLDLLWTIVPSFHDHGWQGILLDFVAVAGLGGVWLAVYGSRLKHLVAAAPRHHGKRSSKRKGGSA